MRDSEEFGRQGEGAERLRCPGVVDVGSGGGMSLNTYIHAAEPTGELQRNFNATDARNIKVAGRMQ